MDLKKAAATLNGSFSFGNRILYDMCSSPSTDLRNPEHLADMIWLIGRAYAASPERRTYGYVRGEDGKLKKNGDNKMIPLWKAINANDGKGGYFISIANHMTDVEKSPSFKILFETVNELKGLTYKYNNVDEDIDALSKGIYAVYLYNNLIRDASEEFDGLNTSAKDAGARCKNQISFCSKFLHFHCPGIVFIIDQYSLEGGKKLIPQKQLSYRPKFEKLSNAFEELDLVNLLSEYKKTLTAVKSVLADQKNISLLAESISKEHEKISSYIEHCVRAYCISKHLRNQQIKNVTPRLIDDLFLRIKK